MGKTIYLMNVSLDLRIEQRPNENGAGSWMRITEELHRAINARAARLALSIQGRVIYDVMESFWPAAADDDTQPAFIRDYGRIWTAQPKVLVSNSRREAQHNTRVVGGPGALDELARLRRDTDGEIGVGGAGIATQLLKAGLLDELLLAMHPVVLGTGRSLFDDGAGLVDCDLAEHETFPQGVVLYRYVIRH